MISKDRFFSNYLKRSHLSVFINRTSVEYFWTYEECKATPGYYTYSYKMVRSELVKELYGR